MTEAAAIINGLDSAAAADERPGEAATPAPRSLVIMDELGRGTSVNDGAGLAWAIVERLREQGTYLLFATHFDQLTSLEQIYRSVQNLHLHVEPSASGGGGGGSGGGGGGAQRLKYTYKLEEGRCETSYYGLAAARLAGLPRAVLGSETQGGAVSCFEALEAHTLKHTHTHTHANVVFLCYQVTRVCVLRLGRASSEADPV